MSAGESGPAKPPLTGLRPVPITAVRPGLARCGRRRLLRITRSFVAAPIVLVLARHPLVDSFDLSHLRLVNSGAAPLKAELAAEASKRLGCEVVQGYGMTELSPVSHLTPAGWFKPGSMGITAPSTQTRIADPVTGADLGTGEEGEVWMRGPQVMKGYLNNPQATAATVDADGWLHTGDLGYMDADGHLYVADRLKELIKYKGVPGAPGRAGGGPVPSPRRGRRRRNRPPG